MFQEALLFHKIIVLCLACKLVFESQAVYLFPLHGIYDQSL